MVRAKRAGLMELCTKETMCMGRNRDMVTSNGQMAQSTLVNSSTTTLKGLESTGGLMGEGTMESGGTTRCMEKVCSPGLMEGSMKVNILKTRNRG
jgi:hypothetical protein